MSPQQKIFRVIVLHNKLLGEDDVDMLLSQTPDPEDVIAKMVIGEMIPEPVGDKLVALYRHNLKKQGISADAGVPEPTPSRVAHEAAPVHHDPPPKAEVRAAPPPPPPPSKPPPPAGAPVHADISQAIPANVRLNDSDERTIVYDLLRVARELRASDLHLKSGAIPVVRVATHLRELALPVLPPERVEKALKSILIPSDLAIFEKHNDLDCSFDGGETLGRFRLNMLRQHHGIDGTFRLIPGKVPTFDDLKLPAQCRRFTDFRQGIVLVTGPKGSGKTTTLAALIDLINTKRADHIITIEDPIEFVHPSKKGHVNQREVGTHTKTFANALRASLREAPDVIMVGEMRDLETVALAITAAETGHLVFGTLHTPDAQRTINRVIDVFPPGEQGQIRAMFSESLRGVISQFLVPGVDGRSVHLATEIMFNTGAIANLIRENRAFQLHGIMQTHRKQGMHLMDESLVKLVNEHKVSREDALARAENHSHMEKDLAMVH